MNKNNIRLSVKSLSFPQKKVGLLSKLFRSTKKEEILYNIYIEINSSDSPIVILGPSGSGKSTLLRCINFLEKFDGTVTLNDIKLSHKNIRKYRKNFGFVFQESGLFPNMTALENIIYTPIKEYSEDKQKTTTNAIEMMKKFGIYNQKDSYPHNLSGGQKQKVAIIRSLILKPKIMFFDEPTSALDSHSTETLIEVINEIKAFTNLVIVTHDVEFGKKIANTVVHLNKGRIEKTFNL
jgi:ABC-type polar amino acid transport system ATPase subunit